jgi:hypothetical protein
LRYGLRAAAVVAVLSACSVAATAYRCGTTEGTFPIDDPGARPNLYCRATDLYPPVLTSVHGWLVDLLLFVAPTVVVLATTVVCVRRGRRVPTRLVLAALALAGLTAVLTVFAHVGYESAI